MTEQPAARGSSGHRYAFLDGLRGVAALSVAILHLLSEPLSRVSATAGGIVAHGQLGVFVFFVISGFVISHSLRAVRMTPGTMGKFLLRRMARLDPPYWASIALVWVVVAAGAFALHDQAFAPPSGKVVVAHLFYLQYLLGLPSYSDIYWTLCLELQFYLALALLLGLKQRLEERVSEGAAVAIVFGPPLVGSLLVATHVVGAPVGSCFEYWYAFSAGAAAARVVAGRGWTPLVIAAASAFLVTMVVGAWDGAVIAGTSLAIGIGFQRGKLDSWLSSRPFQYLGRISYSLYLVHPSFGARSANLVAHFLPPTPAMKIVAGVIGLALSFVGAELFWRAIERPSVKLSRSLFARPRPLST